MIRPRSAATPARWAEHLEDLAASLEAAPATWPDDLLVRVQLAAKRAAGAAETIRLIRAMAGTP